MKFKDFEIRPDKALDGAINPKRFELIKWYNHEPLDVTNVRTGKVENSTRSCFVVAWLTWSDNEKYWSIESVGMRLMENWRDGLNRFVTKWCEMAAVCMNVEDE